MASRTQRTFKNSLKGSKFMAHFHLHKISSHTGLTSSSSPSPPLHTGAIAARQTKSHQQQQQEQRQQLQRTCSDRRAALGGAPVGHGALVMQHASREHRWRQASSSSNGGREASISAHATPAVCSSAASGMNKASQPPVLVRILRSHFHA